MLVLQMEMLSELFICKTDTPCSLSAHCKNHLKLVIYVIHSAAQGPGVHSAFNRNEYQKQKNVCGE
jgi:hypothetical protein